MYVKPPAVEILIDTREQTPLMFDLPSKRATLHTGDYSITGFEDVFTIERKSLPDLVHTVIHDRQRFERELERMTAFEFRGLVIVAPWLRVARGHYPFSMANPRSVIASVNAFEMRYGLHVAYCYGVNEAAKRVADWCYYFAREKARRALLAERSKDENENQKV